MIKILPGEKISALDKRHLELTGQKGIELMEQAAKAFSSWFCKNFDSKNSIIIWCGAGNNGGDGFAIARILKEKGFTVSLIECFEPSDNLSTDCEINRNRILESIRSSKWRGQIPESSIAIDAFLGVGLKGTLRNEARDKIKAFNSQEAIKVSVDIPSGLKAEGVAGSDVVLSDYTISFAQPKLSLLLPENEFCVGDLKVLDIGIDSRSYHDFQSDFYFLQKQDVKTRHKLFHRFSHKGDFGKIMLVGGGAGKVGAILLSGESALRTGSGLVFLNVNSSEILITQIGLREAMTSIEKFPRLDGFDAIGIGPGWGMGNREEQLEYFLNMAKCPLVLDADALNLIGENPALWNLIPVKTILTPHLKEFDRLAGESSDQLERWAKAKELAVKFKAIIVLKGANSLISLPDGRQVFNSSGTQFMATAGAGDVLTGMLTSLLGQGYSPENAALCGVFHHGLAGELAGKRFGRGTIARDIIKAIPMTFSELGIS
ncbi:NAD(P)H-hydrate dehydratase [Algoriphagus sediminis]|uniref:Bifunctional NAD(P)H-hydrate repair enzyme n=1 Tax=Algoriphagus sediminis TaxID=3057113 RepID=A0ABT7Y937_9BACT|nr:NAD(P)H-hydrate dehydratase [Algoriphagus sediminis]MDN3203026.1 NAD(P)H-hydrate dehydratase [Algoriphagus sediminis]